jgi:DNA-binding response OmpR family regulator
MVVRFGPFCRDAATRELLRNGREVSLLPVGFELLLLLVTKPERAMSKTAAASAFVAFDVRARNQPGESHR